MIVARMRGVVESRQKARVSAFAWRKQVNPFRVVENRNEIMDRMCLYLSLFKVKMNKVS
jgi:hypothetical protein